MMRKAVGLILGLLLVAGWWFGRTRKSGQDVWVTFGNTCQWMPMSKGVISMPGSWAIRPEREFVLRAYLVDNGSKVLKSTFQVNPATHSEIYATPVIDSSGKSQVVIYGPLPSGVDLPKGAAEFQSSVDFPMPQGIDCGRLSGSVRYGTSHPGEETVLFSFALRESGEEVDGSMAASLLPSLDGMVLFTKDEPVSFVVFTCAGK